MRRASRLAALAMASALACPHLAAAQSGAQSGGSATPAYEVELAGAEPVTGLGALLAVEILDGRTRAPVVDARVSGARMVSPFGAVFTLPPAPEGGAAPGLRLFRADLAVPGSWTLEFTVSAPGRRPATASLGFDVLPPQARASGVDPIGPAVVAGEAVGVNAGPSVVAPGPAVAGVAPSPAAQVRRAAGYSPEAAPFCATCAAEAPH